MNASQKNVVRVAALISFVMLVYAPFRATVKGQPLKYDFVLTVFEPGVWHISVMDLSIQLGIVWGVSALLIAALRQKD